MSSQWDYDWHQRDGTSRRLKAGKSAQWSMLKSVLLERAFLFSIVELFAPQSSRVRFRLDGRWMER